VSVVSGAEEKRSFEFEMIDELVGFLLASQIQS